MRWQVEFFSLFIIFIITLNMVCAENSWAKQLLRAAKRLPNANIKKILRLSSKAFQPKSAPLVAAESGGYHYSNYGYQRRRPYQYELSGDDYNGPRRRETYSYYGPGCYGHPPGTYGNPGYDCKVFHVCQADGRFDKMDCPASLRFNNYLGVCDWPNQVDAYCNPVYHKHYPGRDNHHRGHDHGDHHYHYRERYFPDRDYSYDATQPIQLRANESEKEKEEEKKNATAQVKAASNEF